MIMTPNGDGDNVKASIRVLIAGGGPSGLLAAQALKKQGYQCTVFEQDSYYGARPRDWNFGIYWAQEPLRDCLPEDLVEKVVKEGQIDNRELAPDGVLPFYNLETGDLLKDIPIPLQVRLHRLNFVKILAEGIDVKYQKRIQNVEADGKSVVLTFEDGTVEKGDYLIGAEGAHSKVREFLVGKEKGALKPTSLVSSFTMAKMPAKAAQLSHELHPRMWCGLHPNGKWIFSCVHDAWDGTKPGDWQFLFLNSWVAPDDYDPAKFQDQTEILAGMKDLAAISGEPFRTIGLSIPDDIKCWHSRLSYWDPEPFDNRNGSVTLIGDALHPMTYHRGQGFNNAVLDVANLARAIKSHGLVKQEGHDSAFDVYESEALPRGKEAALSNHDNSLAIHDIQKLLGSHLFVSGAKQQLQVKSTA